MGQLAQRGRQQQMAAANVGGGIQELLNNNWDQIKALVPKHLTPERMFTTLAVAINKDPNLAEIAVSSPETLLSCFIKCTALGLEPDSVDGLGRAYILPYRIHGRMEAQFILGYKGYIDLARRSGDIKSIHAQAVYMGDEFDCWEDETGQHFKYRPGRDVQRIPNNLTDVYMSAHLNNGGFVFERMTKAEVDAIRSQSKAKNGPWNTHYEAMALKTVIRRAARYLPLTAQAQEAVAADEMTPDYTSVFKPVVSVEVESEPAEPERPAQPTDEEKAELRALTDKCVAVNYNEREIASYLYNQWKQGGIEAARVAADMSINAVKNNEMDPHTGEVFDEADLADEDIPFGEDPEE